MESKLIPCKACECNYIKTWTIHGHDRKRFYCECARCRQKTRECETKEIAESEWNAMQGVSADDHK